MRPSSFLPAPFLLSLLALSCSSSSSSNVTSGGAHFETTGGSTCPDPNAKITIAVMAPDGAHLIPDGTAGAHVSCQIDDSHFSVVASNAAGAVIANGSISNGQPTNVTMKLQIGNTLYIAPAGKCTFTNVTNADGKFFARFTCDQLDHSSVPGKSCSLSADGSYFSFADCTGF